jgi:predicted nucleotide-binding protein (sugar kinase/HSP70/actin superfamily)
MGAIFERIIGVIERGENLSRALRLAADELSRVERHHHPKPLVGIVGEIYVRLNVFTNGNLVETIEDAGGEAWMAPMAEWLQYLASRDLVNARENRQSWGQRLKVRLKNSYVMHRERTLTRTMASVISDRLEPPINATIAAGERVFPQQFEGESILTVGRAIEFAENGADLIVNCAPFGCMPGTLTDGIFQHLEEKLRVPIVSLFYDGETDLSHLVRTYLANVRERNSMEVREEAGYGTVHESRRS